MAGDLVTDGEQVHVSARDVLDFWLALPKERQFAKDDALDAEIAARFGDLRNAVLASEARAWRAHPDTLLAAIVLLDQFSRNVHRGTRRAFEADDLAVALTLLGIENGWEARYADEERVFLYMPLMHAEDAQLQALSIEKFTELGIEENLAFARDHAAVIERFGRFPSRNAALGRASTPEEEEYLSQPGAGW